MSIKYITCIQLTNMLTETWLNTDIIDSELGFVNYNVFRLDRSVSTSSCLRGGGIAICVHKRYSAKQVLTPISNVEQLFVSVTVNDNIKIILGTCYIPPASPVTIYKTHVETIDYLYSLFDSNTQFILAGDYNLPNVKFTNDDLGMLYSGVHTPSADVIFEHFSSLNLYQINMIENEFNKTLDLVFVTNNSTHVNKSEDNLVPLDKHHPALNIYSDISINHNQSFDIEINYNFKNANYELISSMLNNLNWSYLYECNDINLAVDRFYELIFEVIDKVVPKVFPRKSNFPHWFSKELISQIHKKNKLHKIYKRKNLPELYNKFSETRALCKILTKRCYSNYLHNIQNSLISNPKNFWSYIKNCKKINRLPTTLDLDDLQSDNLNDIVNMFGKYFGSVYSSPNNNVIGSLNNTVSENIHLSKCTVTRSEVFDGLIKLHANTTVGPDQLPEIFFRNCCYSLACQIHFLFSLSLSSGNFPTIWKTSYIYPVFKSGLRSNIRNYRPISRLSVLPKLFEKLLIPKLTYILSPIIVDNQHGFRSYKSTVTNLLIYYTDLMTVVSKGGRVDAIYTDLKKAFDSVDHSILIKKLNILGVGNPMINWFSSYLNDRKQIVKIGKSSSSIIFATSGVPQGGHLSPLLFIIFINDLGNIFKHCKYLLFADDLKIYAQIQSYNDYNKLQAELDKFYEWLVNNKLQINVDKCLQITFTRSKFFIHYQYELNGYNLMAENHVKDLGVFLSSDLSFSKHITYICNKASKTLGFLKRNCSEFQNITCLKTLYISLVRSILEYGSIIWSPYVQSDINKIESIQHRFLNFISYKIKNNEIKHKELLENLKMHPLLCRRNCLDVLWIYNLLNNKINCPEILNLIPINVPQISLRSFPMFYTSAHTQNYCRNSPINRMLNLSNKINNFDFYHDSQILLWSICCNTFNL